MEFSEMFVSRITVQCLETYFLLMWLNGNLAPNVMTSNQAVAPGAIDISWIWAYDSVCHDIYIAASESNRIE